MKHRSLGLVAIVGGVFGVVPLTNAQVLSTVEVKAEREALSAASVRKAQEDLNQVPGGTAVVPASVFEASRAVTTKDMLDFVPGVISQSRVNEEARLSIRGSGLSRTFHMRGIRLLQDGIPINLADGGSDFQDIDPFALQHVEVYKGANALQYGASSLGGAINFVTPTGYTYPGTTLRADVGSFRSQRLGAKTADVKGPWDYFVSLSHLRSDGFRDFSDQRNTRLNTNLGYKISPTLETRFYLIEGDLNQELPGNITLAQLRDNPRQANSVSKARNSQRDFRITRFANKTTWVLPSGSELSGGLYVVDKSLYHPLSFGLIDQETDDVGVFGQYRTEANLAGMQGSLLLGWNVVSGRTDAQIFSHDRGVRIAQSSRDIQEADNIELHGEYRLAVASGFEAVVGLQAVKAERQVSDKFLSNGDQSYKRTYSQLNPKLGFLWQVDANQQVYANVSHAFEAPTFSETSPTRDLKAQQSDTFEVGSRGKGTVNWDISAYYSKLDNEFVTYLLANPAFPGQSAILNADSTVHYGLELGLGGDITALGSESGGWSWQSAITYGKFKFDGDPTYGNADIPGIAELYLRAKLTYAHRDGWRVSPNIEHVPNGYFVDLNNSFKAPGYTLLGIQWDWKATQSLNVFVEARNLTDKKYAATTGVIIDAQGQDTAQFAPGEGRSLFAGVNWSW